MKRFLLVLLVGSVWQIASAQLISVGALGGVPVPDTKNSSESRPYTVGGSVEVRLPADFAVEADALYRRLGNTTNLYTASFISIGTGAILTPGATANLAVSTTRQRGNSWEFPVLGKYYFRPRTAPWQPFVGAGFAFRTIDRHDAGSLVITDASGAAQTSVFRSDYRTALDAGAAFAAGMRFHMGRFAILPQVRYTRWGSQSNLTKNNETSFLLGVAF